MRTTRASISSAVRGRPGERWAVPSYFWAINFRCQANKVSGVTMLATSARASRSSALAFYGQPPALIVIEAHSLATELFSQHPILFAEIFNDLQLAVVHPPGDGDQQKLEWVEHSLHIQNPLSRPPNRSSETSHLHADPVFGPYGNLKTLPYHDSCTVQEFGVLLLNRSGNVSRGRQRTLLALLRDKSNDAALLAGRPIGFVAYVLVTQNV